MGSTKYLFVERTEDGARVRADVDTVDVAWELDFAPTDEEALSSEAVPALLAREIRLTSAGGPCSAAASDAIPVERDARPYLRVDLRYRCPAPVRDLRLVDDAFYGDDPLHEAIVRVTSGEEERALILRGGDRAIALADLPSTWEQAGRFLREGTIHMVTGYDHLLFLLALLLVAGELAVRRGMRIALRDVALLVTAFTLGHSVTLVLAALDLVVLPSRLVESAIALSIVIVAAWNVVRPEMRRALPWVAFAFGLVHGFGFSSLLRELVLPQADRVVALLAFNVGIEIAQLAFVAVALGPLAWAARRAWYRRSIVQAGSVGIGLVGSYWFVTRLLGVA